MHEQEITRLARAGDAGPHRQGLLVGSGTLARQPGERHIAETARVAAVAFATSDGIRPALFDEPNSVQPKTERQTAVKPQPLPLRVCFRSVNALATKAVRGFCFRRHAPVPTMGSAIRPARRFLIEQPVWRWRKLGSPRMDCS